MKSFILLALTLCVAFATINNGQAEPFESTAPAPSLSQTDTSEPNAPELSAPAVAAYDKLHQTEIFALGGIGVAGTTSESELAFRELASEPNAAAAFIALLDDETTAKAGQLYALLGLQKAKDAQFEARLPAFLADDSVVSQMSGCIMMTVKVKEIAARFAGKDNSASA